MSETEGSDKSDEKRVDKCPKCGFKLPDGARFCQKCGYNLKPLDESEWKTAKIRPKSTKSDQTVPEGRKIEFDPIKRKCPNCGTFVISKSLEQCPECYEMLSPLPEPYKQRLQTKMEPKTQEKKTEKLEIEEDKWNIREGIQVFMNSVFVYIILQAATMGIYILVNPEVLEDGMNATIPIDSLSLILGNVAGISFVIYPIYYLIKNKHVIEKLGIKKENLKRCLIFGSIVGVGYYFLEFFIEFLLDFIADFGIEWLGAPEILIEQSGVVEGMPWYLLILFTFTLILAQIAESTLFRGVLHNSINSWLQTKESTGKAWKSIFISAVVYALIYFIFNFNVYYLIFNLLSALFIGAVFEYSNRNLYSIIAMQTTYTLINIIFFILV